MTKQIFEPACLPCILNQGLNSAKLFGIEDKETQLQMLNEIMNELLKFNGNLSGPLFSSTFQSIMKKYSKSDNPYKLIKEKNLEHAKQYIPYLSEMIKLSDDKIEMAIRAAILGNTIDLGANPNYNLEDEVNKISSNNIALDDYPKFLEMLEKANTILFVADNYEEAIFDKLLLNEIKDKDLTLAVRSTEILNDISLNDAKNLGLDKICKVMESGSRIAGTDLDKCNDEFMSIFNNADLVIAKGQGNFETLYNAKRSIFFMFKVKCQIIANLSSYPIGTSVLFYKSN